LRQNRKNMATLFNETVRKDLQPIGKGYALRIKSEKTVEIYLNGNFQKEAKIYPAIEKRLIVIDLVERCGVEKSALAQVLSISRQSVDNWVKTYRKHGSEGLVNNTKESWKKNPKRFTGNKARAIEEENKLARQAQEEQELNISFSAEELKEYVQPADKELFSEEHDYEENRYAGSFIFMPIFVIHFEINKFLNQHFVTNKTIFFLFAMMQINRIFSIEQLKTVFKKEFGKLLGLKCLSSIPELWKQIHEYIKETKETVKKTRKDFFIHQIKRGLVGIYNLFIDGHFIPYYGKSTVHKGWYTQRGMAMPGVTALYAHDKSGKVVYFDIYDGKADIVSTVKEIHTDWKEQNLDICPLISIDREIWGVNNFTELQNYRIVTWEKFSDETELYAIPETDFKYTLKWQKKEYKISEAVKTYSDSAGNQITMRRLVYWKQGETRRFALVTTDNNTPCVDIAEAMLNRWGSNENTFKYMNKRVGMHYNPDMDTSKVSPKQQIKNPEYTDTEKQLKTLKKQLKKCEQNLGKTPITINKEGGLRKNDTREKLQLEHQEIKQKIELQQTKLKTIPQLIELEKVTGETFKSYGVDGKIWWDLSGTMVWNSRKKLIEIFKEYLPNQRDTIPVLEAIIAGKGWIKVTKTAIIVRLEPLERESYRAAQIQLCRHLNTLKTKLGDSKILYFDVGKNPYDVQN